MMVRVGLIAIVAIVAAMPLRREKGEFALLIVLAAGMIIFVYALARMRTVIDFLNGLIGRLPVDASYIVPLFKMLGITYVADFAASFCRESGYSSVAGQVELFAKLSIIALSVPELMYLVDVLENFL